MGTIRKHRYDQKFTEVAKVAAHAKKPYLDPAALFSGASSDDISEYTPAALAAIAQLAEKEIRAFDRKTARITLYEPEGVTVEGQPISVIAITTGNKPFLYDSVMGEVNAQLREIFLSIHPILVLEGKEPAKLLRPGKIAKGAISVSHIQVHMPRLSQKAGEQLVQRLDFVLSQVRMAVSDWKPMQATIDAAAADLAGLALKGAAAAQRDEALAFLAWLRDNNFTFIGIREYVYTAAGESGELSRSDKKGLGILSDPDVLVLRQGKDQVMTTPEVLDFLHGPDFLIVTKANVRSVVHRRAYMDYVGIKRFDKDGNVAGELRVVGLFTSTAYTRSVTSIPLLRSKVQAVVDHFGYDPESHSGKLLLNTLEAYPRDDLFQIDAKLLSRFCQQINELNDRPRVRVLPRIDRFDRFVSVIVYVPRDQYDSIAREKIATYLKLAYNGRVSAYYPAFPEGGVARVHIIIGRYEGKTPVIPQDQLERDVRALVTRWEDQFNALGGDAATHVRVPQSYKERYRPEDALADIEDIASCRADDAIRIAFYRQDSDPENQIGLKIFHADTPLELSRRVPLLENLGFSVISEQTHELGYVDDDGTSHAVVLHDMEIARVDGAPVDLAQDSARLEEAFLSIWRGDTDNDRFNRLVVTAGLGVKEAMVLRAYARYLRQTGIAYSQEYMANCLTNHAGLAASLFLLFEVRFDPAMNDRSRAKKAQALRAGVEDELGKVPSLDDDRIIRRFVNAIEATLRTSYFQRDAAGNARPALAFKLDSRALEGLPEPRPYREIFVYSAEVEGVHLRFGPVARGGLRWSDRAQDYRTEVLGLVKAQQVKNAVIVPVGAKGGFYPKRLPTDQGRDAVFEAGRDAYKLFIRTLLSVTDNIDVDHVVPPADTKRHDGDDPYFVVAADKGTATFSDTANAISQEHGFWLDDAFASGGSAGYDHKKMGITARGAWEAVKRHFREMDIDIQTTPFTVAGVGDMSGDVFGNGMLLSPKIRLVAAFDHRDIFIDPDPDFERAFAERQRLFDLPRSSWQDYDRAILSPGAMVVSRSLKSVELTPQAAAAIGLSSAKVTPQEIMSAILKMDVDLMWFGGIGTYIKAASEPDAEVGDRANDPIRVAAHEVRARVIGEGANLGVTQKGRIAYAARGGRCNSDAIDNSAGVNSSDVEVNIKIALANAMRSGQLTRAKRNTLLAAMTDQVAELVLRNNYLQSLALSLGDAEGVAGMGELARLMANLEGRGLLSRKVEYLPDDLEIAERRAAGRGLTRPEIGVLLSYAKIVLFDEIVASKLPDDPYFRDTLLGYFPPKMVKSHAGNIEAHRLSREIVATVLGNDAINRGGPAFVVHLEDQSGATAADVVKAFVLARDGLGLNRLYDEVDGLDTKVPGTVQNDLYRRIGDALRGIAAWALKTGAVAGDLTSGVAAMQAGIVKLAPVLAKSAPDFLSASERETTALLTSQGVPARIAADIAGLSTRILVPDILLVAELAGADPMKVVDTYFGATDTFRIGRIQAAAERLQVTDHFENLALSRNLDEISEARRTIAVAALRSARKGSDPFAGWMARNETRIKRVRDQILGLAESGDLTVARLTVAAGMMSDLARSLRA